MTSKIIVALDYEKESDALALVDQIDPNLCRLKVGKEMFTTLGINFVKQLHQRNFDVFLPSRYIDKALTAELIFITSPYSPKELYDNFQTSKRIDRFDQLERRIQTAILVEKDNIFYTHYNNESREYEKDDSNFFTNPFESQSIHRANSFFTQFETTIQRKE